MPAVATQLATESVLESAPAVQALESESPKDSSAKASVWALGLVSVCR